LVNLAGWERKLLGEEQKSKSNTLYVSNHHANIHSNIRFCQYFLFFAAYSNVYAELIVKTNANIAAQDPITQAGT
jgi:hypothetical protein